MTVTHSDFLALAKSKISNLGSEIEIRCCINRAYYSAYHYCKEFHDSLMSPGYLPAQKLGAHSTLFYQLQNPSIPNTDPDFSKSVTLGYILSGMYPQRRKADYYLNELITVKDANYVSKEAERIITI